MITFLLLVSTMILSLAVWGLWSQIRSLREDNQVLACEVRQQKRRYDKLFQESGEALVGFPRRSQLVNELAGEDEEAWLNN